MIEVSVRKYFCGKRIGCREAVLKQETMQKEQE